MTAHRVRDLVRELESMDPELLDVLRYSGPARQLLGLLSDPAHRSATPCHICGALGPHGWRMGELRACDPCIDKAWSRSMLQCDSGRHAQRGDPSGAPSEGCQSGGAEGAASPTPLINQETPHAR